MWYLTIFKYATVHTHWGAEGSEWVNVGGTGSWQRYNSETNYPQGSYKITMSSSHHSDYDINNLKGSPSLVVGRTGSSYYNGMGCSYSQIQPDPFIRFFLFPF
jgi:hypothetical protein